MDDHLTHKIGDVAGRIAVDPVAGQCSCATTYETYEGPEADCPVHGAVRALTQAQTENARLIEEITRLRDNQDAALDLVEQFATAFGNQEVLQRIRAALLGDPGDGEPFVETDHD